MPFSTNRSSARGTPRGLFGSNGAMIDHSKSVNSYRRGRLLIVSPVRSHLGRGQAETPLIALFSFAEPALNFGSERENAGINWIFRNRYL
jgi:hypothetical protein